MKHLRHFSLLFISLIAAYLLFACAAAFLPDKPIQKSIIDTNKSGDLWVDYVTAGIPQQQCQQDNFTDILILNQAWHCSSDSLITSILLLPRSSGPYQINQANCLYRLISGESWDIRYYGRYWHGSTFLMRFLLLILGGYPHIRLFLYVFTSLLLFALCYRLCQLSNVATAMSVLGGFALLNLFVMQISIQFAPALIIALIGSLIVCQWYANPKRMAMLLFAIGSLTAYFDLLTIPILTVGIPVAVWVVLASSSWEIKQWQKPTLQMLLMGILWALGYALTWITKWIIATAFTSVNVLKDGFNETSRRTNVAECSRMDALLANTGLVPWSLFLCMALVLVALAIYRFRKQGILPAVLLLLLGFLPLVWYFITSNHSFIHAWFTYRALIVSLVSWLLMLTLLIDWPRLGRGEGH